MQKKKLKFFLIFFIFVSFLVSCTSNKPSVNKAFLLILKTEKFRFSDTAFIDYNSKKADIEGYFSGKVVLNLRFGSVVCVENVCMDKGEFNARYLHYTYYDNIFLDIVNKKRLEFEGSLEESKSGFVQMYKDDTKDITYKVKANEVFFRDKKNSIIIKIKEL